jgi:hypothetical protein
VQYEFDTKEEITNRPELLACRKLNQQFLILLELRIKELLKGSAQKKKKKSLELNYT